MDYIKTVRKRAVRIATGWEGGSTTHNPQPGRTGFEKAMAEPHDGHVQEGRNTGGLSGGAGSKTSKLWENWFI